MLRNIGALLTIMIGFLAVCAGLLALNHFLNQGINYKNLKLKQDNTALDSAQAYIEQAEVTQFSTTGELEYQLKSPKLQHFEDNERLELESPVIKYQPNNHYEASANSGTLTKKQYLKLSGDVLLKKTNGTLELTTSQLDIDLKNKTLASNARVRIDSPEGYTTSHSLSADIDNEMYQLKNRVRGVYEP